MYLNLTLHATIIFFKININNLLTREYLLATHLSTIFTKICIYGERLFTMDARFHGVFSSHIFNVLTQ